MKKATRKYNYLIISTDEERFPPPYETPEMTKFRRLQMPGRHAIKSNGLEFLNHHAASTACAPSRASLYTGHYPSLHGVSQTDGLAKGANDSDMLWLDPDTVPTMGDYFRAAGYETWYKGKWHVSNADINVPGTHDSIATNDIDGNPIDAGVNLYRQSDRLDGHGFGGWIGPEPHGALQSNCAYVRDSSFADDIIAKLRQLEIRWKKGDQDPWLVVSSFLNPHDIVLSGALWGSFGFPTSDDTVPPIPQPPTQDEDLSEKPTCQKDYAKRYRQIVLPQPQTEEYRKFYYYLHKYVDVQIQRVYHFMAQSAFFSDTIVVFTSDHGEMLGAHGGMHQKWYNAYEESTHVPLVISNPDLFDTPKDASVMTSHVDLLPTLLGISGIDQEEIRQQLAKSHSDARPLVGRDLSQLILSKGTQPISDQPIYFATNDEMSEGNNQLTATGNPYDSIAGPNHIESVITRLAGVFWKYVRYYDINESDGTTASLEEFELYNLDDDQIEINNLAFKGNGNDKTDKIMQQMAIILTEQREQKALTPIADRVSQ
ncbi:MAG: arylsulfatase A-like enzyme [Phenylobacterium sp.]|jgi:arylsulfatase A-like enzyme